MVYHLQFFDSLKIYLFHLYRTIIRITINARSKTGISNPGIPAAVGRKSYAEVPSSAQPGIRHSRAGDATE
jgi:hypothetical protein